ncbi:hypothetical protein BGW38_001100 [Lunasporangiospora selenospora]|uniref:Uncharacterized protein n=1 Tax=Lunasporangiospora selenospora TaxID=979761 RepID=A0A9P6KDR7_9FUNG|nr:hypothetical protein BGW38_001100 [Lunasporangiospora selenospora]
MTLTTSQSNNVADNYPQDVSKICHEIQALASQLLELRKQYPFATPKAEDDTAMDVDQTETVDPAFLVQLQEGVLKGSSLLSLLKNLNRQIHQNERNLRNDLTEQKLSVGNTDLGYQNIKYQRKYLLNEIARCRDMETFYQDVPLVSLEEFREAAPQTLVASSTDDHQLMLNRLQFELEERKRFDAEKRRLLTVKAQLTKSNKTRKAQLGKIEKQLDAYINSSQSLQNLFEEPMEPIQHLKTFLDTSSASTTGSMQADSSFNTGSESVSASGRTQVLFGGDGPVTADVTRLRVATTELQRRNDIAQLLPHPLYVLFRQACAFSATFGEEVRAEIQGDVQAAQVEARVLSLQQNRPSTTNAVASSTIAVLSQSSSSGNGQSFTSSAKINSQLPVDSPLIPKDGPIDEDDNMGKNHSRRGTDSTGESQYERFPLDVVIKVKKDAHVGSHTIAHLKFGYLTRLGVVVVAVEAAPGILKLDSSLLLQELFPHDFGEICPNPEAAFLGMSSYDTLVSSDGAVGEQGSDLVLDVKKSGGYAFRWAQELCGLEFLGPLSQGWGVLAGAGPENSAMGEGDEAPALASTLSGTGHHRAFLSQIIRMIRNRRRAWKALERQLEDLERSIVSKPKHGSRDGSDLNYLQQQQQELQQAILNARTKVSISGWRSIESSTKYSSRYSVQFMVPDQKLSSRTVSAKAVLVDATVEISIAYVDRMPIWELKPGPAFPALLKSSHASGDASSSTDQSPSSSMAVDEQPVSGAASPMPLSQPSMSSEDRSPFLDSLMNTVNSELPGALYRAEPNERNMLLSLQLTKIVADLSTILETVSS